MTRLFALLTFGALTACASSQPPAPTPREKSKPPQEQSSGKQNNPEPTDKPTAAVPQDPKGQPRHETQSQDDGTPSKWWDIAFGGIVALFTIVLAVVAERQRRITDDALKAAQQAASAASDNAVAAKDNAAAANKMAELMEGQLTLARESLHATERAWLSIDPDSFTVTPIAVGDYYDVTFELKNYGRTVARLEKVQIRAGIRDMAETPLLPKDADAFFQHVQNDIGAPTIEAGSRQVRYMSSAAPVTSELKGQLTEESKYFCVAVRVQYNDAFGNPHTLVFAAGYKYRTKRFAVIAQPEYNYST